MSAITLELTNTSKVRVPEIQYSSTASTSAEYEYPSHGYNNSVTYRWCVVENLYTNKFGDVSSALYV